MNDREAREALNRIHALADSATEGPWRAVEGDEYPDSTREIVGPDGRPVIEQVGCGCCGVGLNACQEDIEMVTAARAIVPAFADMLSEVLDFADRVERDGKADSASGDAPVPSWALGMVLAKRLRAIVSDSLKGAGYLAADAPAGDLPLSAEPNEEKEDRHDRK